jgi:hypothetical protein
MVMQRPAKPRTPVRFRPWPPFESFYYPHNCGFFMLDSDAPHFAKTDLSDCYFAA